MLRDRWVRFALGVGIVEWLLIGGVILFVDRNNIPLIGTILVITTWLQLGALFLRGKPRGAVPEAQELFMAGEYGQAAQKLETWLNDGHGDDLQAQTLFGNTYRQLGELERSEALLRQAVAQQPDDPFPLYGLGRTLLAAGDYAGAIAFIQQALDRGGRKTIRAELALAHYLNGDHMTAAQEARRTARQLPMEGHRVLMVNYLLFKLQNDPQAPQMIERNAKSLAYWEEEAKRFAETSYGKQLQAEVTDIHRMLAKD